MAKKWLNKKELAKALSISYSTLWRAMKSNQKKARRLKLRTCPMHSNYSDGRKYYIADEVLEWLEYVSKFN